MVFKSILIASILALANFATATPPACLLAAINQAPMIADFGSICGDNASDMQNTIQSICKEGSVEAALSGFADACKAKGHEVAEVTPSSSADSSASATATGTDSAQTAAQTGFTTTRVSGADAAQTSSPTGSASPATNTGGAGQLTVGAGVVGAAAMALFAVL